MTMTNGTDRSRRMQKKKKRKSQQQHTAIDLVRRLDFVILHFYENSIIMIMAQRVSIVTNWWLAYYTR